MAGRNELNKEKGVLAAMVKIYCIGNHKQEPGEVCTECQELLDYAYRRLDKCPFGNDKPTCAKCTVHCYKTDMRRRVREVMRYSGRRMIFRHPSMAVGHLLKGLKGRRKHKD